MSGSSPSSPAPVITLVNDDPIQLSFLSRVLERADLDVRAYASAEAALGEMDRQRPPSLVVTDLYMPGIDGWRFCRLLRSPEFAPFNAVPILVVSATYAGDEPDRIAADLGAESFLAAPVDPGLLAQRVLAILQGRQVRTLPRVLIVEDSRTLAGMLRRTFHEHGYRADSASTVAEALAAFGDAAYDVAVLDYHLPDGLGDTLLDAFRSARPDCVCLMMTTDPGPALAMDWMKRGAADYLRKPFQVDFLLERCARARRERALLRVQDMLEQRTRELRESETRMGAFLSAVPDLMFTLDAQGNFIDCHVPDEARLFMPREDLMGRNLEDVLPPDVAAATLAHVEELRQRGATSPYCFESAHGGETRHFECRMAHCSGDQVLAMVRDITDQRRAEADGEILQAQLLQAQKMESIGRLAGGVAHDFNNMLCVIIGLGDLLLSRTEPDHASYPHLAEIQRAAQRSADLTRQLLAFARRQAIAPRVLDLNPTVEEMLLMLRRLIGEDIVLTWTPSPDLWRVRLDPSQIDQILANLCVNARDAIRDVGTIHISTRNRTVLESQCLNRPGLVPGDYVLLTVSDDGHGMDEATRKLIFEPFFTTKAVGKGTGLGLATVYGIVKQNRGWIDVASEPGEGAAITVYLPRDLGQAEPRHHEEPAPRPGPGRETILLVEDEPAILAMAVEMLEGLGHLVLPAGSPAEALRLAEGHRAPIDLVLADLVLPAMNGPELARALRALHPEARTLYMSGFATGESLDAAMRDEGAPFLEKPFSLKELEHKVREALGAG
ncbi:response regulator [Mesoterricola silvestris]|uniref:histidine kinase n=1 Tax=Mesoterricola silvestris TaxID=2927979 RepID=A0AA48GQ60_9BACT|nr:response regulator [Mesoterricola silvestris]BDU73675.1 hypothetical protein METEAL_28490 [Mesoterricola silvestris]